MSVAPLRRGGALALVAGVVFLVGVTLYQGLVLRPTGYLDATTAISAHQQFGPYLLWASAHTAADTGYRITEGITFVLALALPGALGYLLWPFASLAGRRAIWLGRLGFGAFVLQIALTAVSTPLLAHQYASQPGSRPSVLHTYVALFGFETILASVVGGGLLTAFLVLVSLRGSSTGRLPGWLAYLGLATAGLLGVSALFSLFAPTQPETSTSPFAFLGLSLWLITLGILLLSVQVRAATPPSPEASTAEDTLSEPGGAPRRG